MDDKPLGPLSPDDAMKLCRELMAKCHADINEDLAKTLARIDELVALQRLVETKAAYDNFERRIHDTWDQHVARVKPLRDHLKALTKATVTSESFNRALTFTVPA